MWWRMCVVVGVAACGRISFDARLDASQGSLDGAGDTQMSDASTLRACPWTSNPTVGPLVKHDELNTGNLESDPLLVRGDPLTMYFSRDVADYDILVAHRPSIGAPFDPPQPVAELAMTGRQENALQVDSNGHGYYVRTTTAGNTDIFEIQRDTAGVFNEVRQLSELDTGGDEYDPITSPDGLTLWFTAGPGNQHVRVSSRASTSDMWSPAVPFQLDDTGLDGGASITGDGLLIMWTTTPTVGVEQDIKFAVRASTSDLWGAAQTLAPGVIDTSGNELEPSIREDGCELFFARSAGPSDFNWDIYSVTLQ